ncbi:hypothetical protein ACIFOE_25950 [Paenibacillus sp. NRS-1783]|uniref:hypothetical protein n=1 Tax=Paenibacillus sp. NRS-1783 TaxID=3233907 RepID=UPI003D28010B
MNINDKDDISLVRWHDLFNGSSFTKMDHDFLNEADAERLIRLLSLVFNVFDIHKDDAYRRKNVFCFYYQHQVLQLTAESYGFELAQDRLFFLHHLLFELGLGDDIYEHPY